MENPVFVSANDPNLPLVSILVAPEKIKEILDDIQYQLTKDKVNVNGYMITTLLRLHWSSVSTYWRNLQQGLGHTTKAKSNGNFSINMKGLLNKILRHNLENIDVLYLKNAVTTLTENLPDREIELMVLALEKSQLLVDEAFNGWNPELLEKMDSKSKYAQQLHYLLRGYFGDPVRQAMLLDRVAFQLSYGNSKIKKLLKEAYHAQYNYDPSMRRVQWEFHKILGSEEFQNIIAEELGNCMTEMINKMFISI